jgi:serpin B
MQSSTAAISLWKVLIVTILTVHIVVLSKDAQDVSDFTISLYKNLGASTGPGENVAISPFSLEAALSMTFVGARGTTQSELGAALGINQNLVGWVAEKFKSVNAASGPSYMLKSANGIFLEQTYPIRPEFRGIVTRDFGANISAVDFVNQGEEARLQINSFVEANTNNRIRDLFTTGSLGPDTRLVLVNALYFKADWEKKFDASKTSSQPFTLSNGLQKSVELMYKKSSFSYGESAELGGAQVLELPYQRNETSMFIILPTTHKGLDRLEQTLTAAALSAALGDLRRQRVNVFLPKFKINAGYDLIEGLESMGIRTAFTDQADFRGISEEGDLKISKVVQKVFIGKFQHKTSPVTS